MATKTIVVTTVTGAQGSSVARTFLQSPGWQVRGITRNPSSEAAKALAAEGVEVVQGDLDDGESLVQAFQGATAIFSNADYFTHLFHAMAHPEVVPAGQIAAQYAHDREVEQGMNIAYAAEAPTVLATLERFVLSALSDAAKYSRGRYPAVYHFNSKAEMVRLTHAHCPGVTARMSTVQMGHYVENWRALHKFAPKRQDDGTYLMARTTPVDFQMPLVVARRDTGAFVQALVERLPVGTNLLAISEMMNYVDFMAIWGRVHGVAASYKQISNEEFWSEVPEDLATELRDGFDYIHEFGFTGGDPDITAPQQLDFKIPVTTMEEWIRDEDWSPVLAP